MNIKIELLSNTICDTVRSRLNDIEIDADQITDTAAISIVNEIKEYLKDDSLSEFDIVENIVSLFERNDIDCNPRHDF